MAAAEQEREPPEDLSVFMQGIGYQFEEPTLLQQALTHRSAAREQEIPDNERLEFLGDAVLELVASEWLFSSRPDESEGLLTQRRSRLVSSVALQAIALRIDLARWILMSVGEERSGGRGKRSVLANTVEALIGAIYLDGGLRAACEWALPHLAALNGELVDAEVSDAKNRLQELLQGRGDPLPEYQTVAQDGPAHAPTFVVECLVSGSAVASGTGSSKQQAQRKAAQAALSALASDPNL